MAEGQIHHKCVAAVFHIFTGTIELYQFRVHFFAAGDDRFTTALDAVDLHCFPTGIPYIFMLHFTIWV